MNVIQVGTILDKYKNSPEGVRFDINDAGAELVVCYCEPTSNELEQFEAGKNFEIRFTEIQKIIMMTVKIGNLNWMDAPYTPHLSKNLTTFTLPNDNQGLGLTLILIDTSTGEVKHLRYLSLSSKFTKDLFGIVMEQKMKPFDKDIYAATIQNVFMAYTTKELVKLSKNYCKINL